jgi:hypothetical protein
MRHARRRKRHGGPGGGPPDDSVDEPWQVDTPLVGLGRILSPRTLPLIQ